MWSGDAKWSSIGGQGDMKFLHTSVKSCTSVCVCVCMLCVHNVYV